MYIYIHYVYIYNKNYFSLGFVVVLRLHDQKANWIFIAMKRHQIKASLLMGNS